MKTIETLKALPNVNTTSQGVGTNDVVKLPASEMAQNFAAFVLGLK